MIWLLAAGDRQLSVASRCLAGVAAGHLAIGLYRLAAGAPSSQPVTHTTWSWRNYISGGREGQTNMWLCPWQQRVITASSLQQPLSPPFHLLITTSCPQPLASTGTELGTESCSGSQVTQGAMGRDHNIWGSGLIWCLWARACISVPPTPGAAKEGVGG